VSVNFRNKSCNIALVLKCAWKSSRHLKWNKSRFPENKSSYVRYFKLGSFKIPELKCQVYFSVFVNPCWYVKILYLFQCIYLRIWASRATAYITSWTECGEVRSTAFPFQKETITSAIQSHMDSCWCGETICPGAQLPALRLNQRPCVFSLFFKCILVCGHMCCCWVTQRQGYTASNSCESNLIKLLTHIMLHLPALL